MTEQELLQKMVAPGARRAGKYREEWTAYV